ncbi:MAG: sigma-54-dependent Fis family transcriptional regulator [Muribaculaceae bacterium]|nr:sigma-54-dependent Fis family transcriptional regulator [Muribaculaceae bacterium]
MEISPNLITDVKNRFGIIGTSPTLMAAVTRAIQVAPIDLSVLIIGESGSGKEFFPKIIHNYGARKHSKYIAVNCGAIPEGTIDSELFGHEKGAFTGAVSSRKGYFEEADGGTIFLDEVAELPLTTQARLLRVLESGEFLKVGSSTVQKTNIRIVAATNVDMLKAVEEGRFREDLYYRLSTVLITIPPLRDRGSDIALLARKFASDFAEKYHTKEITFDDSARNMIKQYRWPGNVRQLKNVVEQISLFEAGTEVTADTVAPYIPQNATVCSPTLSSQAKASAHTYEAEREILFGMILRLQKEIETLKNIVMGGSSSQQLLETRSKMAPVDSSMVRYSDYNSDYMQDDEYQNEVSEVESQEISSSMTLEDTERETIRRSLERNGGRRKATAQELRISERTLYRKIREYGLD